MLFPRLTWISLAGLACAGLLMAAAPTPAPEAAPSYDLPEAGISAADGKAIYMKKCKKCHGPDGKANTKMGKKHEIEAIPGKHAKAKVLKVIKNGKAKTKMKSFAKKLSEEEMSAVADFVMTLSGTNK